MKTERRHELQENDLAGWLGEQITALRPYGKVIIGVALLAVALLFALSGMQGNQEQRAAQGWNEYFAAASEQDVDGLREVSERYARTEAGAWALQSAGDIELATGSQALFRDRAEAIDRLKRAREDFEAANNLATTKMLKQRSLMGLAQAYEALNEFDNAASTYQQVIGKWPDSALAELAQERLALVEKSSTREFYEWFMQQTPKPLPGFGDDTGGEIEKPSVYGDLPSNPALSLPDESDLDRGSGLGEDELTPPEAGLDISTPKSDDDTEPVPDPVQPE